MTALLQPLEGAAALVVGVVLLAAGVPKALASAPFAQQISNYGLVPSSATRSLARAISSSELLAGAMLIVGILAPPPLRQVGAGLAVLLFALFLVALGSALGRSIPCACFGGNSELETVGVHSLVRTSLLLVLAAVAVLPTHGGRELEMIGLAAVLAALGAVATELARLLGPLRRTTGVIVEQLNDAANHAEATT